MEHHKKRRSRLEKRFAEMEQDMDFDAAPPISDSWDPNEETNQFDGIPKIKTKFTGRPQEGYFPDKEEKKFHIKRWMNIDMGLGEHSETSSDYSSSQTRSNDIPETSSKKTNRRPQNGYLVEKKVQDSNVNKVPDVETIEDSEDDNDVEIIDSPELNGSGSSNPKWWEQKKVYESSITWKKNNFQFTKKNDQNYSEDIDPEDSKLQVSNWNFPGNSFFPETKKKKNRRKKKKNNSKSQKKGPEENSSKNAKNKELRNGLNDVKNNEESKKIKKRRRRKNKNPGNQISSGKSQKQE